MIWDNKIGHFSSILFTLKRNVFQINKELLKVGIDVD